jgi:hypothetical protein
VQRGEQIDRTVELEPIDRNRTRVELTMRFEPIPPDTAVAE